MATATLHHPGIVVSDLDIAVRFYCATLGYELYSSSSFDREDDQFNQIVGLRRAAARFCMLRGNNSYIEIFEYEDSVAKSKQLSDACEEGIRHLAFVVDDVETSINL